MTTFAALAYRDFRILWGGLVVSGIGLQMQQLGLGWLMVELAVRDGTPERAPLYLGFLGLGRAIPGITFSLFSGVIVDRFDRRRLLIPTYLVAGANAAFLAALTLSGRVEVPFAMVSVAVGATALSIDSTSRVAMIGALVPERALMSANGLSSFVIQTAGIVGPLLGGLLIAQIGTGGLFAIHAATYVPLLAATLALRPPRRMPASGRMLRALTDGLRYAARDGVLRSAVALSAITSMLSVPYLGLMPAVAHEGFGGGPRELSWLLAAIAAGSLPAAFVTASIGSVRRRGVVAGAGAIALGCAVAVFALQSSFTLALLAAPLLGFANTLFVGTLMSLLLGRATDEMRGRVFSLHVTCVQGLGSLGVMAIGALGTQISVNSALVVGGVATVVLAASVLFATASLRELRTA